MYGDEDEGDDGMEGADLGGAGGGQLDLSQMGLSAEV